MRCMHCHGRMEHKQAPFHVDRQAYLLQLDAVPAWVCTQCGEAYFEEKELKAILAVIQSIDGQVPALAKSA